mmetsp:Transcript_8854/g.19136  ORF Transcript_8854/g.19136 Transcript_8854/m.19136 type:complete len:108 (-) Transcript_8854:1028-1351(-)
MIFPWSLIFVLAMIGVCLLVAVAFTVNQRRKRGYQQLITNGMRADISSYQYQISVKTAQNYQNTVSSNYALPPRQDTVTYCVIDERMVDSPVHSPMRPDESLSRLKQ